MRLWIPCALLLAAGTFANVQEEEIERLDAWPAAENEERAARHVLELKALEERLSKGLEKISDKKSAEARKVDDWENRWYVDPIGGLDYPAETAEEFGWQRSEIRSGDMDLISRPVDFLGVNFYTRQTVSADPGFEPDTSVPRTAMGWEIHPPSLGRLLDELLRNVVEGGVVQPVEPMVEAAPRQELPVCAGLDDAALVQHDDPVGAANRGEAVGDHHAGASFQQRFQRVLDLTFGIAVDAGGGLVEHQDSRIRDDGAGEADELALAEG